MELGQSAGKSYAYLLGVYLGDGCVSHSSSNNLRLYFRLNTIDEDFALATKKAILKLGFTASISKHEVKKSSKPNHALFCSSQKLSEALRNHTWGKMVIPEYVDHWPIENRQQFIIGLMDSEGFVAEKTQNKTGRAYYMGFKVCDPWIDDFIKILQGVGIKLGKVSICPPYRDGYKPPTRFHIKMQSWVDSGMRFNIKRKQDRVDRWASTEPYSERSRYPRKLTSETIRQPSES